MEEKNSDLADRFANGLADGFKDGLGDTFANGFEDGFASKITNGGRRVEGRGEMLEARQMDS
jgi:hypothetical protein